MDIEDGMRRLGLPRQFDMGGLLYEPASGPEFGILDVIELEQNAQI